MDACWSVVIISNLPFSLPRSRGEYLRVCWNSRDGLVYPVYYPFQNYIRYH